MPDQTQIALMRHFKFTEDDLVYNRRGEIGPNQQQQLKRADRISTIMLGLLGLFLLAVLGTSVSAWAAGQGEAIYLCSGVVSAVLLALGAWATLREQTTVPRLETVSGPLTADHSQQRINRRTMHQYSLVVGEKTFPADRKLYDLLQHGGFFTVYYEVHSRLILGIEPGGPTANLPAQRPLINPNRDLVLQAAHGLTEQERRAAADQLRRRPEAVRSLVTLIAERPANTRLLAVVEALHPTAPDSLLAYLETDDPDLQRAAARCLTYLAEQQGTEGLARIAQNGVTQRVRDWAAAERAKLAR
ncbi:MAG: HEAT repeat domain-containing protein [Anaerolineae bacterium]|nr:HEAT repeat domain-containing protein [Anaerolineae bacterium]